MEEELSRKNKKSTQYYYIDMDKKTIIKTSR